MFLTIAEFQQIGTASRCCVAQDAAGDLDDETRNLYPLPPP